MKIDLQSTFASAANSLDRSLSTLTKSVLSIDLDERVRSSLDITKNTPTFRNNIQELYDMLIQLKKATPFDMRLLLYFDNMGLAVSEKGSCSFSSFCQTYFADGEDLFSALLSIQTVKHYQTYIPKQDYLIISSSLPLIRSASESGRGLSCIFIPWSVFYSIIPDLYLRPDDVGLVLIRQDNGQILYQNSLSEGYQPETDDVTGNRYCMTCEMPNCNMKIALIYMSSALLDANASVRRYVITSFLLLLLIGIGLSFIMSIRNYHPIKKIAALTGQVTDNELHSIASSISDLQEEKNSLQLKLKSYYTEQQEQALRVLLTEKTNDINQGEIISVLPDFPMVIACISGFDDSSSILLTVRDFLESLLKKTNSVKTIIFKDRLVAFLQSSSSEETCSLLEQNTKVVEQLFSVRWIVGISHLVSGIHQIQDAYKEAEHIIDYATLLGTVGVYSINTLPGKTDREEIITLADYMRLQCAIRSGLSDEADQIFDHIIRVSFSQEIPLSLLRCRFFGLINTLVLALSPETDAEQYNKICVSDDLINCNSVPDLVRSTKKVLDQIHKIVESQKNERRQNQQESISNYIQDHFSDPNLTVSAIAEHFGIHPANISRAFSSSENSILDLIHGARIRQAQKLLKDTDHSVHQIAIEVGYTNDQSFFRTFKRYTGFSPGVYRSNDVSDSSEVNTTNSGDDEI